MSEDKTSEVEPNDCIIPPEFPKTELRNLMVEQSEFEVADVTRYIEWQCNKARETEIYETGSSSIVEEIVEHAEKIKSDRVFGTDYAVWDVHTNLNRWWDITNPTNLYSQKLMPSADYTLSFHIGLMARVAARREPDADETLQELISVTQRKIFQAQMALDAADEAEEFQAVGLRCREAMTSFVKEVVEAGLLADLPDPPKRGDFVAWSDHVIGLNAGGGAAEYVRGYLKAICQKGWQLANWLTHAKGATRSDAALTLAATEHVLHELTSLTLRSLARAPERCGRCGSYKITVTWRPDEGEAGDYIAQCDSCGAERRRVEDPHQQAGEAK